MWQDIEKHGYDFIKEKIDKDAIYYGMSNSNVSDIYSSKLEGFIEVKDLSNGGARCGQFTNATSCQYFSAENIKAKYNNSEEISEDELIHFVIEHYKSKNVVAFLVYEKDVYCLYSYSDFIKNFNFTLQVYNKASGTRKVPKKDRDKILKLFPESINIVGDKLMCLDRDMSGQYFEIGDDRFFISKNLEVRKCSKTKNRTYLVEVKQNRKN